MIRSPSTKWFAVACLCLCPFSIAASSGADHVLISGDDVSVTRSDFVRYLEVRVPEEQRAAVLARPDSIRQLLSQLYITRTLAAEAKAAEELDREALEWRAELERDRVYRQALIDLRIAEKAARTDWDNLAREHYTANRQDYEVPERVRASHVLIGTAGRSDEEAVALADEIAERARAGEDFAALVSAYSDDPSADANAGDLGFVTRGQLVPEFEQAAFALEQEGDIAGPVKTQFGYHVIRFVERSEARLRPFEEVRDAIIRDLKGRQAGEVQQTEVERVRSADTILVNHEAVELLEVEMREPEGARLDAQQGSHQSE
jgi:peptidyl-prolyl cis-trans isomerase C